MVRKFSSYGPVSKKINYYVPREELVTRAYQQLIGEDPEEGGHFFTVWAPRQTGKSWVMREVMFRIYKEQKYDVAKINLEAIKDNNDGLVGANYIIKELNRILNKKIPSIKDVNELDMIFIPEYFKRPLILILDEFDALEDITIQELVSRFRDIYLKRKDNTSTDSHNPFLLHGLALIGVRSVLGIQNQKGSPFNIQRSLFIPNLTYDEMKSMYDWYTQDSGQEVEKEVLDELYFETNGQPGLISWFGELLTETYNPGKDKPIDKRLWNIVYSEATAVLPNNTILNLISKAEEPESKPIVMELFRTDEKMYFRFDNKKMNYLYTNGVIDFERVADNETGKLEYFGKFSCPFVQKRLFNCFSYEIFDHIGAPYKPFEDLSDSITDTDLYLKNILRRYEQYLKKNKDWLLKDAPRRSDMRIYEAIFHFNLYRFVFEFLLSCKARVYPEFPTGNGKVDLFVFYQDKKYLIEVKSFSDVYGFREAVKQSAAYAKHTGLQHITLAVFVESIPEDARRKYETTQHHKETGVDVEPVFIVTG